jgi:plasmid replication initiation protein
MGKSKSEMTVTQSNLLIESRYKLSLSETKILLWMIKEIHPGDKDFKTYKIFIKDFIDAIDSKRPDFYTVAKAITKRFMSKVLELENGNLQVQFMSMVKYSPGDGFIKYRFDKALKPYLIRLKRRFTSYDIQNIVDCRYSHSIRIYQLLKSFEDLKERTITVKDLRYMLMVEDEYTRFYDFKRFILERSMKDLKKHSDLFFEYSLNKRGRNIHSVTFTIKKQKQKRLFDGEDFVKNEAVVSYQEDATGKVKQLQKEYADGLSYKEFSNEKEPKTALSQK